MTSVRVHIHNETDQPLLLREHRTQSDWLSEPPGRIEPRSTGSTGTESSVVLTGTWGNATYQVGDDPSLTVYMSWSNPFMGPNRYHADPRRATETGEQADPGHYASWRATGSSEATAHYTLRNAGVVSTDFLPSRDAWLFTNHWDDSPYTLPALRGTALAQKYGNASNGLCGGMVFGALDYFFSAQQIPQMMTAPPDEQDPLFLYLVDRLFATFDPASVTLMLALINPLYPDSDENPLSVLGLASGRAAVMAHEEWPLIRADIDAGRPSPMFLQMTTNLWPGALGDCHQVLAYAYEVGGHDVTLHLYDPNTPPVEGGDGVRLHFNDGDVSHRIVVDHNVDVLDKEDLHRLPIYCFARMNYTAATPAISTRHRLSSLEVSRRRVNLGTGEPVPISSEVAFSGRRTFDIWPDCGSAELSYTVLLESFRLEGHVKPIHFYEPVVTWRLAGVPVPEGTDHELVIPRLEVYQPRPDAEFLWRAGEEESGEPMVTKLSRGRAEHREVRVRTTLVDGHLTVVTRPEDGSFALDLKVSCREPDDPEDRAVVQLAWWDVLGWREDVPGLTDALGTCLQQYVDARRDGLPEEAAVADLVRGQLGHPDNPLWDPDPVYAEVAAAQAAQDPRVADARADLVGLPDLTTRIRELQAGATTVGPVEIGELTAEQLQARLQAQLGGAGGLGGGLGGGFG